MREMQTVSAKVRARALGTVVGMATTVLLIQAAPALAAGDALTSYGSSTVHVPFSRAYAFAVSCAALPCKIKLTEHATAKGRHVAGLDKTSGPPITMTQQPSAGPEPHCSEQEEAESLINGTCAKKEAWEEQHEAEEERRRENSPRGKTERAEDEYCTNVLQGEYLGSFVSNGHVYTRCAVGQFRLRHEVTVNETETHA